MLLAKSYFLSIFLFLVYTSLGQTVITSNVILNSLDCYQRANLEETYLEEIEKLENIFVHKLCSDSLSTAFLIWVRYKVAAHRHEHHSEVIYVLEGSGLMRVGDEVFDIDKGDYVFIPVNTVHGVRTISSEPLKVLSVQSPEFKGEDRVLEEE